MIRPAALALALILPALASAQGYPDYDNIWLNDQAEVIDAPKVRSPRIIVGAGMAGLAAASLGGFVYAAAADRAIVRGYRELTAEYDATGTYDEAVADRLDAEAPVVRGLAIGLGVTTAALTAASLGLLLSGRRRQATAAASSLSIHPQVRRDLGGVAITGRF